ncbi:hypothetical protein [Spirillospora sp. NPDC047279]|uniref:hypothetical protein n=1 Tax=Spirillospora sp. NPDC047279 TaxID=3155478 RepID=UPI0033EAE1A6
MDTERFLVRAGLPQLVPGWHPRTHVIPRMLPGLAFLAGGLLPLPAMPDDETAFIWMGLSGAVACRLAWQACTALRTHHRVLPWWTFVAVLVLYFAVPVIVVLVDFASLGENAYQALGLEFRLSPMNAALVTAIVFEVVAAVWLVACYAGVSLGVIALVRIGARQSWHDLLNSARLHGRALPTLLFVTFLAFFAGEMWQLGDSITWPRMVLVLLLFAAVTVAASASRLGDEILALDGVALTKKQTWNVLTVLATRQIVQATVVGLGVFAFFTLLGVIAVDPATATTWVGAEPRPSIIPGVPQALLRCAALLAGFGALNFAVTTMTDQGARGEFFRPIVSDLEEVLTRYARHPEARPDAPDAQPETPPDDRPAPQPGPQPDA